MEEEFINFKLNEDEPIIIKVIGVGGGGINVVNHILNQGIHKVEFVVCDTDVQALQQSQVKSQIQLGKKMTNGRGTECLHEKGRLSVLESLDTIKSILQQDTRMVFIIAGMGGRTGSGAAPEIAKLAKELDILTIGIVTVPFSFEGKRRIEHAKEGIDELKQYVDSLLIIPNERYDNLKIEDAFSMVDNILTTATKSIAEMVTVPGYVCVDFYDIKYFMRNSGVALIGIAEAKGENRAMEALNSALISYSLNGKDIQESSNILLSIIHGYKEAHMDEISLIVNTLNEKVGKNTNVIWHTGKDETLEDRLQVVVITLGFNNKTLP